MKKITAIAIIVIAAMIFSLGHSFGQTSVKATQEGATLGFGATNLSRATN